MRHLVTLSPPPTTTCLVGVSTGLLDDEDRSFDRLVVFDPDIVELYGLPTERTASAVASLRARGVRLALHAPTPFDDPRPLVFLPASARPGEATEALAGALRTVELAAATGAQHVVVHFPSPRPPYVHDGFADRARRFLDPVADRGRSLDVPVLIENMTPNPCLREPDEYAAWLAEYDTLGFCLDLGHAHLLRPTAPDEFLDRLGPRIRSVHVYDLAPGSDGRHEPVHPSRRAEDGWVGVDRFVATLVARARPATVILEPHPLRAAGLPLAREGFDWLRSLLPATRKRR